MRLLLAGIALAAAAPAAAAADRPIAAVDRPTTLSAYGSSLVYSKRDPATDRFRLWLAGTGRVPDPLGIPERDVPFDADLGPGTRGQLLAVYSRCASEPPLDPENDQAPPGYTRGKDCDLYQYDFSARRERKLAVSSPRASEVYPTVWGNTVAFARVQHGHTRLYARSGLEPPRRLAGGPVGGSPVGLDLRGRRLAFGWTYYGGGDTLGPDSELRVDDVVTGARRRVLDDFPGGGLTTIGLAAPSFSGRRLYWARLCQGDSAGCPNRDGLMRTARRTGIERAWIGPEDMWQSRGSGVTYVLHDSSPWRSCYDPEIDPDTPTCTIVAKAPRYGRWTNPG